MAIQARLKHVKVEEIDFGCYSFPVLPGVKVNHKLGQPEVKVITQGQKGVNVNIANSPRIKDINITKQGDVTVKDRSSRQEAKAINRPEVKVIN